MELREKIAAAILRSQEAQSLYTVAPDNLKLADAVLAIPEIAEALELQSRVSADAMEAQARYMRGREASNT